MYTSRPSLYIKTIFHRAFLALKGIFQRVFLPIKLYFLNTVFPSRFSLPFQKGLKQNIVINVKELLEVSSMHVLPFSELARCLKSLKDQKKNVSQNKMMKSCNWDRNM